MKNLIIIFIFLGLASSVTAQSISVAPITVPIWGKAPSTLKFQASYKYVSIGAYIANTKYRWADKNDTEYEGAFYGLWVHPYTYTYKKFYAKPAVVLLSREYPTSVGTKINFEITAGLKLSNFISIEYSHMSNGFGLQDPDNVGLDNIGIRVHF